VPSLKPTLDQHYEVSARMEQLYRLCSDLEIALQDAERQRNLIAKLRREADEISRLFESIVKTTASR
jgi:exoribonuclease R